MTQIIPPKIVKYTSGIMEVTTTSASLVISSEYTLNDVAVTLYSAPGDLATDHPGDISGVLNVVGREWVSGSWIEAADGVSLDLSSGTSKTFTTALTEVLVTVLTPFSQSGQTITHWEIRVMSH